jgi:hypothetical protein
MKRDLKRKFLFRDFISLSHRTVLKVEHASPQVNVAPVFEEQALNI